MPMRNVRDNQAGFTLAEVLVTLAITGVMMSAVYGLYIANIKAVNVEERRVEMQQDQRIALDLIVRELRSAGADKTEKVLENSGIEASILDARSNYIYFATDRNSDGDVDDPTERIAFCVYDSNELGRALGYSTGSTDAVGDVGSVVGAGPLALAHGHAAAPGFGAHQPFAPIENLEFLYTLQKGAGPTTTLAPTSSDLVDIRSIQVTVLSRINAPPDRNFASNETFNTPGGQVWGPFVDANGRPDGVRRRMTTANVRLRNMGLE